MMKRPLQRLAVIVQRTMLEGRWASFDWTLHGVVPDVGGEPRTLVDDGRVLQCLHSGFEVMLYPDEAEGYYLNVSSETPSVFVSLRADEATGEVRPFQATLSYNEAARWMDGGERVERTPAWIELAAWLGEWVEANYRPEPKQRRRPKSFEGREGRFREEGQS